MKPKHQIGAFVALALLTASAALAAPDAADGLTAYSMLTHDGRRLVSRPDGTNAI